MRKLVLFVWLLLPVGAAAYHYGPGQERLRVDEAAEAAARARDAAALARQVQADQGDLAAKRHWAEAEAAYTEALAALPGARSDEGRRLRLERATAMMQVSKLPDARRELLALVDELEADVDVDPELIADARSTLGNAQYYTTWLLRLEGEPRDVWEPEIEAARQNYKLVAARAESAGDDERSRVEGENLEAALRLARMDLTELQGLPLPSV
ncbi:MAG TPA: hypothetical protein VMT18_10975 [Planctomycetota bacterium]|nr:hypothetical protein [Planctomycetota bacterium]